MNKPLIRFLFLGDPRTDRRVKNFISFFHNCNYDVELIFATPGQRKSGEVFIEGVLARQLPLEQSGGVKMFLQYDLLLKDELRTVKWCDVLFACELYSLNAAANSKKERGAGKLFYDSRELYTELPSVTKTFLKKWYWKKWERKGLQQTDLVIVTAPDDADAVRKVHGFLPPNVLVRNLPKKEELKPNSYLRNLYAIPLEKKIFVYVGGLQQERGLEKMIDAISLMKEKAVFVIIGEGSSKEHLQLKCRELNLEGNIFFHPSIESGKVIEVLNSADVGVSLIEQNSKSYALALPSKVFEYMLAGLPVISSPLKQVKDLFNSTDGILFVDPYKSDELLSVCQRAIIMSSDIELKTKIYVDTYNHYTFDVDAVSLQNLLVSTFDTLNPAT